MKMNMKSNAEPFPRALATLLLTAAAVCILSGSARAQLYISQDGTSGIVGKYNANSGRTINPNFITGLNTPDGLAVSGNHLFVSDFGSNTVREYNAKTGAVINANFITGLNGPEGLLVSV